MKVGILPWMAKPCAGSYDKASGKKALYLLHAQAVDMGIALA